MNCFFIVVVLSSIGSIVFVVDIFDSVVIANAVAVVVIAMKVMRLKKIMAVKIHFHIFIVFVKFVFVCAQRNIKQNLPKNSVVRI